MFDITQPQSRCCSDHASYDELIDHLAREFLEVGQTGVAREVARALAATRFTGLGEADDQLLMCELVARHQLQLLTGRQADAAKLDPQPHPARSVTFRGSR